MIRLRSVDKPLSALESAPLARTTRLVTPGFDGKGPTEPSRSLQHLVVRGRSGPISSPLESVIGRDDRVRVLDTELFPWRMVCALRMRSPDGAGAVGTGWFVGPRTVLTAGHCVFSTVFFDGWADTIEVVPGMNGPGESAEARPFGSVTSRRFSTVDRWTDSEDPDFDIGCIHLDEPLGDVVGWFALGALPAPDLEGYLVNVSGYPADRGGGSEQYHARNRVLRVTDRRVFYEVDTFGGQSGAPVWIHEDETSPPLAVAVHAYGVGGTPSHFGITANSAPRILPEVLETVAGWVEQDGGWPSGGPGTGGPGSGAPAGEGGG
ncbi:trypsin-like serine peptidase [Thalassiella azotivora]